MHKNILLSVGITILFLCVTVAPLTQGTLNQESKLPISNGNTLYVGGTGEGNYTKIQDAIDNASDGDTVFVYDDSSPYYEHVKVNKSINLIGEDRDTTIIDGSGSGNIVRVTANCVNVSGFTIQKGDVGIRSVSNYNNYVENNIINNLYAGMLLYNDEIFTSGANGNTIYDNFIKKNRICGIEIRSEYYFEWEMPRKGCDNQIYRNIISYHETGIDFDGNCRNNEIFENIISDSSEDGILFMGMNNKIFRNNIVNNTCGISNFWNSINNKIFRNNIVNNTCGIYLEYASIFTTIKNNNFIDNYRNVKFLILFSGALTTRWIRNYWDNWIGFGPKCVLGTLCIFNYNPMDPKAIFIPWIERDWLPARKPYDITTSLECDIV